MFIGSLTSQLAERLDHDRKMLRRLCAAHVRAVEAQFNRRGIALDPLPALVPFLITESQFAQVEDGLRTALRCLHGITDTVFGGDRSAHARYLRLTPLQQAWAEQGHIDPALSLARPDCVITDGEIRLLEFNVGSGIGYVPDLHLLRRVAMEAWSTLGQKWRVPDALTALSSLLKDRPRPCLVIRSMPVVKSFNHDALNQFMVSALAELGVQALSVWDDADVARADVPGARTYFLSASTYQLEYRRRALERTMNDLLGATANPVVTAASSLLLESKGNLVILSSEEFQAKLPEGDARCLRSLIPRTLWVTSSDAGRFASEQSQWVLKRASDHGGNSVCVGPLASGAEFERKLMQATRDGDWVAQQLCRPDAESNLIQGESGPELVRSMHLVRLFWVGGGLAGIMSCACDERSTAPWPGLGSDRFSAGAVVDVGTLVQLA